MVSLKDLTRAEWAVCAAFPQGSWVDLRQGSRETDDPGRAHTWGPGRTVRAEIIEALLLGHPELSSGVAATLRVQGARIRGRLNLAGSQVHVGIYFAGCRFDESPEFTGATTHTISMTECDLDGFSGRLLRVDGDLHFEASHIHGSVMLRHGTISGSIHINGVQLRSPGQVVSGGGLTVEGGFFGRDGLIAEGGIRLIGARIVGGVFLEKAYISNPGGVALCLDQVVTPTILCTNGFTSDGEVQLRDAEIQGLVSFEEASLNSTSAALQCQGMRAGRLRLAPKYVNGPVDLGMVQVKILQDTHGSWPPQLRLDGLTYEYLQAIEGQDIVGQRLAWLRRDGRGYRPQPYEQLAAFYRRIGHDHDARRVLLAKQRRRRATLTPYAKAWAYLLDATVGYGYRPWLAGIWFLCLLGLGTAVFTLNRPWPLYPGHNPDFNPFIYSLDLLIPIGPFGLRNTYRPAGIGQWIAYVMIIAGWVITTVVIAGITRVLRRD